MDGLKKAYYRTYQQVFDIGMRCLHWRKPIVLSGAGCLKQVPDVLGKCGVEKVMEEIKGEEIGLAVLKARSPTCGVREIYDGTFTGTKIKGAGIFAEALIEKGISVMDEEELETNFFLKHKEEL